MLPCRPIAIEARKKSRGENRAIKHPENVGYKNLHSSLARLAEVADPNYVQGNNDAKDKHGRAQYDVKGMRGKRTIDYED